MADDIGLFEAIFSLRAVRHFKPDAVPRDLVYRVLEAATKAPNGGNRQPWHFVVVDDHHLRGQVAEAYRKAWYPRFFHADGSPRTASSPSDPTSAARQLADHLEEIPVLIFVCMDGGRAEAPSPGGVPPVSTASRYASIFPAVQNLLLAARGLGLGTTITTALTHARRRFAGCWASRRRWRSAPWSPSAGPRRGCVSDRRPGSRWKRSATSTGGEGAEGGARRGRGVGAMALPRLRSWPGSPGRGG